MKKLFFISTVFSSVFFYPTFSQYVQNGSFESKSACPNGQSQINLMANWKNIPNHGGTSDYYNTCGTSPYASIPTNWGGTQTPRTGEAYIGAYVYGGYEYIYAQLACALTIGEKYYAEMFVNRTDNSTVSVDKMGIAFTTQIPSGSGTASNAALTYIPKVENSTGIFISDQTNWTKISGIFTADSAYDYILIGNFQDDAHTNINPPGGLPLAYYFIDDVKLVPESLMNWEPGGATYNICKNQSITINGATNSSYSWSPTQGLSNPAISSPTINVTSPISYTVVATYSIGCVQGADTNYVHVHFPPVVDIEPNIALCAGDSVAIDASTAGATSYLWNDGSTNTTLWVDTTGYYTITVADNYNCSTSDSALVQIKLCSPPQIPNVFSPNGDGKNDALTITYTSVNKFKGIIYDRWGTEVYTWDDISKGWEGKDKNGQLLTEGSYYLTVKIENSDGGTSTKGAVVQLIR